MAGYDLSTCILIWLATTWVHVYWYGWLRPEYMYIDMAGYDLSTCILIWLATTWVHVYWYGWLRPEYMYIDMAGYDPSTWNSTWYMSVLYSTCAVAYVIKKIYRVQVYCLCSLRYMDMRLPIKVLFILHSSSTERRVNHCAIRTITTYTTSSLWWNSSGVVSYDSCRL